MNNPATTMTSFVDKIANMFGYIRKDTIPISTVGSHILGSPIIQWAESQTSPTELRAIARQCEILRAVINVIKENVSSVPFKLSLKQDSPYAKKTLDRAWMILTDPNEEKESIRGLIRRLMEDLLILDAGALEIRNAYDGLPRYVGWIPADEIRMAQPSKPGTVPSPAYYRIQMNQVVTEFEQDELIYFVRDKQPSGYGLSPVEVLKSACEAIIKGQTYNREYFDRGTMIDGILNLPELHEDELRSFRQYWNAMIQGKRHVFAMTNARNANWLPLRQSNKDMEFHQHLIWLSRLVCMIYGISPQEIGITYDINRATAEVMDRNTIRRCIRPWLVLIKERLEEEILHKINPDIEFIWQGIDREDALTQAQIYQIATAGRPWMEPDEVRQEMGFNT
ncbi:MAG: phage portal protein [bacterium]